MKKYEFTGEEKEIFGRTVHRIRAVCDFGNVKKGDLGGWIEKEENLSHDGNCWVGENAWVRGNAWVGEDAYISKTEDYLVVGPIGSRNDYTTFYKNKDNGISVSCGCFNGTIEEFLNAVEKTHGDSKHALAYRAAVDLARIQIERQ